MQTVKSAIKSANTTISETAARTLCEWQSPSAIDDILNLASTIENQTIKILAIRGAVRLLDQSEMQAEKKTTYLKQALQLSQGDQEKRIVLSALGNCPTVDALKITTDLVSVPSLKNEAAAAMISISRKLAKSNHQEVKNALSKITTQDFDQLTRKKAEEILNSIK
jgi:hypothetical protein